MDASWLRDECDLVSAALSLGARKVRGWSAQEERLTANAAPLSREISAQIAARIQKGNDPLGSALCRLRSAETRRALGATYTPSAIISSMLSWARAQNAEPARIVEPGAGSGRFLLAAARLFKEAELVGIELDPLPAMIARANLSACSLAGRSTILVGNYRSTSLPAKKGATLYVGNPPYVRHHQIDSTSKQWLTAAASRLGHEASQLSGLHVYFFLATAVRAQPGDLGVFITAAEWLDVNYGQLVRDLFLNQLGGESLTVIEPTAKPFEDAETTAAISTFLIGSRKPSIRVARVADPKGLGNLTGGKQLHRGRLEAEGRWSHLMRKPRPIPRGYVELGEICRVHRGQATGANRVWIAGPHSEDLPTQVLFRTVTRAKELFAADGVLSDASGLRDVIDLPTDLDVLAVEHRRSVARFLRHAKKVGADSGYIARTRRAWWSVGLRSSAPILATYMARRPPAFVVNLAGARHLNIAHGLYPREPLAADVLNNLARYLSRAVSVRDGRTYAGGLTKFEPREMERLIVPSPEILRTQARQPDDCAPAMD
ncbi:MAG: N-6 DNA methylase [Candidatus Sulfotelmatobacter sp.]